MPRLQFDNERVKWTVMGQQAEQCAASQRLTLAALDTKFRDFLLNVYHIRESSETNIDEADRLKVSGA